MDASVQCRKGSACVAPASPIFRRMLGATGPVVGALDQTAPFLGENMGKLPSLCSLIMPNYA